VSGPSCVDSIQIHDIRGQEQYQMGWDGGGGGGGGEFFFFNFFFFYKEKYFFFFFNYNFFVKKIKE